MAKYQWAAADDDVQRRAGIAFANANGIIPKHVVGGSEFFVRGDEITTWEFEIGGWDGKSRIWHDGCCRSTHFAKHEQTYPLVKPPEDFGFVATDPEDDYEDAS